MDDLERQAVEDTLLEVARRHDGGELTHALDEFGWLELVLSDPPAAVESLFVAQGRAGSWSSAFSDLLTTVPLGEEHVGMTVLIPRPGASTPSSSTGSIDGYVVGARAFENVLVAAAEDHMMRVVDMHRSVLVVERSHGLDSGLLAYRVTGQLEDGETQLEGPDAKIWWSDVVSMGRRALAFQLCGAMEEMLRLALDHAAERRQFGRPIGAFQAVRHRLADSHVLCAGARATARASFDDGEADVAAAVAKVVAGRSQRGVSAHCQQVLAGMGFTAGHPFHRLFFRSTVLDRLLGSAVELAPVVGRMLMDRREPPRLAEL